MQTLRALDELSGIVLAPIAPALDAKRFVIVPDAGLQYVPFAALPKPRVPTKAGGHEPAAPRSPTSREAGFEPLIAGHEVVMLPSAAALLDSVHPERSGIVLSLVGPDGRPRDGFLRMHDIYNLRLSADLVVLSACRTALGKEMRGEGLVGLTRGFFYGGAPAVVASLWDVRDRSTAELMTRLYRAMLRDHLAPAAALRAAQVSMWRDPVWTSPAHWAGFVLEGDWRGP